AFGALADLDLRLGVLQEAVGNWERAESALEAQQTWGGIPLPLSGWVFIRKAETLYEWDDLAKARNLLQRGMQRAELGGDARTLLAGHLLAVRIDLAAGETQRASENMELARPYVEETPFSEWTARFQRQQVDLWLAENRSRPAIIWAGELLKSGIFDTRPDSELAQLAVVRGLLWGGKSELFPQMRHLLGQIESSASKDGKTGILIEAKATSALLEWANGDLPGALAKLNAALELAEPERFRRLFADLGLPMWKLLQEANSRGVSPDYIQELLAAFRVKPKDSGLDVLLPDSLTHREREVLMLLVAGLTNREIGVQLVISPETVKKHTGNIYGKLGVKNRMEAAKAARKLKIIN
ncbi:MAG: LuxR C-terminal-related transcriptional regulator, partial [Anaerolineales bacterium]